MDKASRRRDVAAASIQWRQTALGTVMLARACRHHAHGAAQRLALQGMELAFAAATPAGVVWALWMAVTSVTTP